MSIGAGITADSDSVAPPASPRPVYPRPASRRYRSSAPATWSLERPLQQVEGGRLAAAAVHWAIVVEEVVSCHGKRRT